MVCLRYSRSLTMDKSKEIKIPYDGQPFRLGMLYDSRNSCVVPGISLSGESRREPLSAMDSKPTLDLQTEKRQIHFDVTASVKFSLLFFSKTLSAKYLLDHITSANTVQVTVKYQRMSFEKRFFPSEETSPAQRKALEGDVATHMVTSIKYGCEVSFTFEKEVKDGQSKHDAKGPMVKYLKTAASGIKLDEEEKTKENNSDRDANALGDCKVHITGDLDFSDNEQKPKTLEEALQYCRKIPKLLGNKAFPKEISLSPLCKFAFKETKISQLDMGVSVIVEDELKRVIQQLANIIKQAQDITIRAQQTTSVFRRIDQQLQDFIKLANNFCFSFQQEVSKLVENADKKDEEDCTSSETLHSIYQKYLDSPFAYSQLKTWLDLKEKEITVLEKCLQFLKSQSIQKAFKTGEMEGLTHSFEYEHVVSFEFTMIGTSGTGFLTSLEAYLINSDKELPSEKIAIPPWFLQPSMKVKMLQFVRLVRTTSNKQKFCFAVTDSTDRSYSDKINKDGVRILKYTDTIPAEYEIPPRPGKPSSLANLMTSIEITWNAPEKHALEIKQYQISYWQHNLKGKRYTVKTIGAENKIIVNNLESNTGYCFAVCGICCPGTTDQSEVSDVIYTEGSTLAKSLIKKSNIKMSNGQCSCIEVPISEPTLHKAFKIAECVIGASTEQPNDDKNRTILLTGTSMPLINEATNAIFNSIMSVSSKEKLYFKLTSPFSTTNMPFDEASSDWITIYKIHQQKSFPISLTIIEFPNFGVFREKNYAQLEACFMEFSISHLNSIILVSEEYSSPITLRQKYSLWSILSMFGNDLQYSIVSLTSTTSKDMASDWDKKTQADYFIQANIQPSETFQFYPSVCILAKNKFLENETSQLNEKMMKDLLSFIVDSTSVSTEKTVQILQKEQKVAEALKLALEKKRALSEQESKEIAADTNFLAESSLKPNPLYDIAILDQLIDKDLLGHQEYLALKRVQAQELKKITLCNFIYYL